MNEKKFSLFLKVCDKPCCRDDEAKRDADRAGDNAALHAADKAERRKEADQRRRNAQAAQRDALENRQINRTKKPQRDRCRAAVQRTAG